MISAFILDDQDANIVLLRKQLERFFPGIVLAGTATDPQAALPLLRAQPPDILFLDIHMPGTDGFGLLEQLEAGSRGEVIFVTAYSNFALEAFRFQAAGYITKPVNNEELIQTVNKVVERINSKRTLALIEQSRVPAAMPDKKLALPTQKGLLFIGPASIYYCESSGNYTRFFLSDGKNILVSRQIGQIEAMLPDHFVRIHDRYIVNLKYITAYNRGTGGIVVLENNCELPVSVRRKEQLMARFQ